jgi:hypothetical protein
VAEFQAALAVSGAPSSVGVGRVASGWYLSDSLDLDETIRRICETAPACPSVYLGLDEDVLEFSDRGPVRQSSRMLEGVSWKVRQPFRTTGTWSGGCSVLYRHRALSSRIVPVEF